jgi:hypothetical protein
MTTTRKQYSPKFKAEAGALMRASGLRMPSGLSEPIPIQAGEELHYSRRPFLTRCKAILILWPQCSHHCAAHYPALRFAQFPCNH